MTTTRQGIYWDVVRYINSTAENTVFSRKDLLQSVTAAGSKATVDHYRRMFTALGFLKGNGKGKCTKIMNIPEYYSSSRMRKWYDMYHIRYPEWYTQIFTSRGVDWKDIDYDFPILQSAIDEACAGCFKKGRCSGCIRRNIQSSIIFQDVLNTITAKLNYSKSISSIKTK